MTTTYWCELAWLGGHHATPGVGIEVASGLITAMTPGLTNAPAGAVRLNGLTLPGLANTHSHAFHRVLRGRTQAGGGSFWTWREQMYAAAEQLDPDSYHLLARAVFGEMALAGTTCVGEFHYLHHGPGGVAYTEPNAMGAALVAAASDVGIRLTLIETCYLAGGFGVEPNQTQRRFSDGDVERWTARATAAADAFTGPTARVGAAIHSVRAVPPEAMVAVAAWSRDRAAPLHVHLSEQPAENDQCRAAHGYTPTELLASTGALGERTCAVHATHLTATDIERLGRDRVTVCLCPTTERDLADGIGPAAALRDAGCRLALGSDSHAMIDLFEEGRAVELDGRLATLERGHHGASALLAAATESGHAALGWPEAGRLHVGAPADFTTVRLDSVRTAGTRAGDALEAVVFAASAADVDHVVVGGEVIVSGGTHVRFDVAAELRRAIGAFR